SLLDSAAAEEVPDQDDNGHRKRRGPNESLHVRPSPPQPLLEVVDRRAPTTESPTRKHFQDPAEWPLDILRQHSHNRSEPHISFREPHGLRKAEDPLSRRAART